MRIKLVSTALLASSVVGLEGQEIPICTTVFDERTGRHVQSLSASSFEVFDDKRSLIVKSAKLTEGPVDFLLLVDTSLVGEIVRPIAPAFINELGDEEQMAVVTYADAADLAQDFTSSKKLLQTAVANLRYGNAPRVLDALFASIDSGFESSAGRRVIILLSAGVDGRNRSTQFDVLKLAREKQVSVYSVFVNATDRSMFRAISHRSGGAYFHAKSLKLAPEELARVAMNAARGQYELVVSGAYTVGSRVEIKIKGRPKSKEKLVATAQVAE